MHRLDLMNTHKANNSVTARMSPFLTTCLPLLVFFLTAPSLLAADSEVPSWHARTLGQAIGYMLLFTAVGIVAAIAGYKLFDKCTPGDLSKEILENKNVAAAIVAAAVIIGVCIIIAAAMLG